MELRGDPLATLVRTVLLEDRLSLPELTTGPYALRWALDNDKGLVFSVVFQRLLPPAYAADLLDMVRAEFVARYAGPDDVDPAAYFEDFAPVFEKILNAAEQKSLSRALAARQARAKVTSSPVSASAVRAVPTTHPGNAASPVESADDVGEGDDVQSEEDAVHEAPDSSLSPEDVGKRNREAFIKKRAGSSKKKSAAMKAAAAADNAAVSNGGDAPVKRGKIMRTSKKAIEEEAAGLDFSSGAPPAAGQVTDEEVARFRQQFMEAAPNSGYNVIGESSDDDEDDDEVDESGDGKTDGGAAAGVFNYFKGLAGMRNLTREDLTPALQQFRDALIGKNVAQDIADRLIESVMTSLEGKRMETMTSVSTTVRNALDDALTRILTPRQSTDILADIAAKKGTGRPYVITYCGVNGVGKSTSLAKTCFYLLNHGHKVMIAACDTFRAGAVEQLRTHVRCLGKGVELFDRGYGKDAAAVANDAIRRAKEIGYDVVLVDTAGRMQDNEPLMRALAKLVEVNRPDRLFFVGEALVGNDAVDQLQKFNAALTDHQSGSRPRLIDGIVLTKFDTIDDKVGAAVSMVYTTGQPIVFVGVGQTYMDLRKINTRSLVKALLR